MADPIQFFSLGSHVGECVDTNGFHQFLPSTISEKRGYADIHSNYRCLPPECFNYAVDSLRGIFSLD